ncbi:MAG: XdhC family protein [Gemmataceae bacterium]|nr:XdhC family protein [Gemmataceae bacterium]
MRELLAELTKALDQARPCVYCSVVETRGSTPQKAGASMLVFPDGSQKGTLGGGCVEAEVKRQALRTLSTGEPAQAAVFTFCLDDNYGWDDGLICGGRMSILAEPLNADGDGIKGNYYRALRAFADTGAGCTEAVVIQELPSPPQGRGEKLPVGSRFLFDVDGQLAGQLAPSAPSETLVRNLIPLRQRPKAYHQAGVAYLPILPRITLLIVGGGHVGQAVAQLAADVDFDVWVLDDREAYAGKERFPRAERRLFGDIGQTLRDLAKNEITPSVYAIIVTRGHSHDEEALFHLATTQAGYVGMIGSKRKIKLIYEDLLARGISKEVLDKVHAPLGFDIGSQTVPEIAVSIVAELIAVRNLGGTIADARTWVRV